MQVDQLFSVRSKLPMVRVVNTCLSLNSELGTVSMTLLRERESPKMHFYESLSMSMTKEEARQLGERLLKFSQ